MKAIEQKENFRNELVSIIQKFDQRIDGYANYSRSESDEPSRKLIEELNQLKIQRYKMKEALQWVHYMTEEEWNNYKEGLQKDFKAAQKVLNAPTQVAE